MWIRPAKRLRGRARLPGDKSISHRAALVAALARGRSRVENFATAADCAATLACLARLGVAVERDGDAVLIEGAGRARGEWSLRAPEGPLDCANSGTTMRLLAGVLACQPFASELTGDASLLSRPMRRVAEPLELMGARVVTSEGGRGPLRVEGRRPLRAVRYEPPVASAQVKSAVLLAALGAEGLTEVVESRAPTRDHTERMLRWFGADVRTAETRAPDTGEAQATSVYAAALEGPAAFAARDVRVPGDVSSAAFLVAAAALLEGSDVTLEGVGLNPTRTRMLEVLRALGAEVRVEDVREECGEPSGRVRVRGAGPLAAGDGGARVSLGGADVARMIDELPVLAVAAARVEGGIEVRDASELRLKESDRIAACVENLRAMGAEVEEFPDGFRVGGPCVLRGARLDARGDHRVAMAFAVAALTARGDTYIEGARECVGVSFPEFFPLLETLAER
ncbi:MAG TPA: 3-phosphoshikimate 1-carboxyvinyltransferase [Pyrinomonadaceae bacterium]|nr:3-phosphoshikimate 1-carboxyvinyltransferase [Pyrinomonadaceae bacterium]